MGSSPADRSAPREGIGPGRIRTYDQGIRVTPAFPPGADYLFTRGAGASPSRTTRAHPVGCGMLLPVIKGA